MSEDFKEVLPKSYAKAYSVKWKETYGVLRTETTNEAEFELADNPPSLLQPSGDGTVKFANPTRQGVTIIHFEHFVDLFTQSLDAGRGKKCDFLLYTGDAPSCFVLNEVSRLKSESITIFPEPDVCYSGKAEKSFSQLRESILRLYRSPQLAEKIDTYQRKVALFAYRLTDITPQDESNPMSRSVAAFRRMSSVQANTTAEAATLPHGFTYEKRLYPATFDF